MRGASTGEEEERRTKPRELGATRMLYIEQQIKYKMRTRHGMTFTRRTDFEPIGNLRSNNIDKISAFHHLSFYLFCILLPPTHVVDIGLAYRSEREKKEFPNTTSKKSKVNQKNRLCVIKFEI